MPVTKIASFEVTNLQVLDEHGNLDTDLEPDLPADDLLNLYRWMVKARAADEKMLKLQRQGRIGTFAPATGQEAIAIGMGHSMGDKDWYVGTYREIGTRLMRGERLEDYLAYFNGYEEGSERAFSLRLMPMQVILGSQLPHAVGLAYGARQLGEDGTAVVVSCGDGATSQGDFHEALNFAGVWKAPVVFVVQNNGWAISHPREAQTASETIAQKAIAYGMPGVQIDGNDVLAVVRAMGEALARARAGEGPTLIEAVTYRMLMHTTADDPKKYRDEDETEKWRARDPLIRFRAYLEKKGLWDESQQAALESEVTESVAKAVERFEARTDFRPDTPFDHVYSTPHPEIEAQRAAFLRDIAEGGE